VDIANNGANDGALLTAEEAAAYLGISRRSFDRLGLDRIEYTARLIRYERSTLNAYKARQRVRRTRQQPVARPPSKPPPKKRGASLMDDLKRWTDEKFGKA
jgi:hypothetical protein